MTTDHHSNVAWQHQQADDALKHRGVQRFHDAVRFRCGHRGTIGEPGRGRCWHCVEEERWELLCQERRRQALDTDR